MNLASLALALACVVPAVLMAHALLVRGPRVRAIESHLLRLEADRSERARYAATRQTIASATRPDGLSLDLPAGSIPPGHEAIASIPFDILDAIPATAATSKAVREIHDDIAAGVYDAVGLATKGIAEILKQRRNR